MPSVSKRWLLAIAIIAIAALLLLPSDRVERFGYSPDPNGAKDFAATLPTPTFAQAAPDAMEKAERRDTFLWRAMDAAHRKRYGTPFQCSKQEIGSCVAHGAAHAVYCSEAVAWQLGDRPEPPLLVHQASIYGGSRVEARGRPGDGASPYGGYSDGSTGYHAARWLKDWGVIWKRAYPSADCSTSTPDMEKAWGAFGAGGKGDAGRLDAEAKKTPCEYVTQVRTWDEVVAAITSGHPITLASSQGFSRTLDKDSFAAPSGVWMHQMAGIGVRFGAREGLAIINSWGDYLSYTAPRYPEDLPDGVFWADRWVVERMLSQGDCWAISAVRFQWREINHENWLGEQ